MRIAIAGGTGIVRRRAVQAARARGHDVVVLSRSESIEVLSGAGHEERLEGVDVVVDALNTPSLSRQKAVEFFRTTSRHLLAAGARRGGARRGVAHHVALSIFGIDGMDASYYAGKLAQLGRHLQGHAYGGASALFAEEVVDLRGPGPSISTADFRHGNDGVPGGGILADEFVPTPASTHQSLRDTGLVPPTARLGSPEVEGAMLRFARIMGRIQEVTTAA